MDISVTTGTIFQGSHLSLRLWFRAIWWITSQKTGVSALGLQRVLGLGSYKTAWNCLHKLRGAMIRPGRELLSGQVEVDEIIIGGRQRGGRGFRSQGPQSMIVAAVEIRGAGSGRVRLQDIPGYDAKSLENFVQRMIEPGSEVLTDGRRGYNGIEALGYRHSPTVLTGKGKQAAKALLPRVHRVASLLKRWLLGIHHGRVTRKHLPSYLEEFAFRFNRRSSQHRGMLFYRTIQNAVIKVSTHEMSA